MATDRSLATLLRALQSPSSEQDASRLVGSATVLLTLLSNPLNIALLTSQLLTAPAIWFRTDGLLAESRILGVFNAASFEKTLQEKSPQLPAAIQAREGLVKEAWLKAVVQGADEKSPRWKHMLVIGGLLLGFENHDRNGLPKTLKRTLESAMVKATNLALQEVRDVKDASRASISMTLGYVFDVLDASAKSQIQHDLLLPHLVETMLFSKLGLQWGYFLGIMDVDILQDANRKFGWSLNSPSYTQVQHMASGPVFASFGGLSRLVAFCISNAKDKNLVYKTSEDLAAFARSICVQWQQTKLSEVDITEEQVYLNEDSMRKSLPLLWHILKSTLFAVVIMETSLLGRVIGDGIKPPHHAPVLATLALHTLRNLSFISFRHGQNAFSQYNYVYMSSVDILSSYPTQAEAFLREIQCQSSTNVPEHPHERINDLFFLNAAEHFALCLHKSTADELFIPVASRYLKVGNDRRLLESFEAAHSVVLAVFSCPQNHELVAQYLPFYVTTLFGAFPQELSSRQFRLAIKTLVRITAPPSLISETQPYLSSTILEIVSSRIKDVSSEHLLPVSKHGAGHTEPALSAKAALVLTLMDSLPFLSIADLQEWLSLTADSLNSVHDPAMVKQCRQRLWEVLSNGEMDVARAQICVQWWNMEGGRRSVLHAESLMDDGPFHRSSQGNDELTGIRYRKTLLEMLEPRVLDSPSYSFDKIIDIILFTLTISGCVCVPSTLRRQNDIGDAINRFLKVFKLGGEMSSVADVALWQRRQSYSIPKEYLHNSEYTAAGFIESSDSLLAGHGITPGRNSSLYETGDLVHYTADQTQDFMGRRAKRSQRVGPIEVEHHVQQQLFTRPGAIKLAARAADESVLLTVADISVGPLLRNMTRVSEGLVEQLGTIDAGRVLEKLASFHISVVPQASYRLKLLYK
ncbi:hypothetical protein MMC17_002514 [Xylographa soralifera]|nr:hypothetical protein [Xylographa soralifera]